MNPAADPVVQCINVGKHFGSIPVLEDINLDVLGGKIHALVGLNGAGKTTLMRLLLGMSGADQGSVSIDGRDPRTMPARHWSNTGHLVDAPLAYPELTVMQNLQLAARLAGHPRREANAASRELAGALALTQWAATPARRLSSGNRQRLGLAAALIGRPRLLILDEPTTALDPAGVMLVRKLLLHRVRAEGAAVFVSSHHLDEVARLADRISIMNGGRLIGTLDPSATDLERQFFNAVYADQVRQ
ncbi:ABC transporter ATP-binding protein [Arthrobacter castelli]|uniref:ABC transporter ATP-binding protein n=1 Tax=Arthrobacter castelli TaxID=271431 RepID=UPI0003FA57F7|nr:ABC transporter ATP-binding protein [Arthrobacter castelli]